MTQFGDILGDLSLNMATSSLEISRVEIDSRECEPGTLFFALPATVQHGAKFAKDAVARGARCVVSDRTIDLLVPVLVVPTSQLRALVVHAIATIVDHPESKTKMVSVTSTNGKTSVTTIVSSLARALSWNASRIATLTNQRTTPAGPQSCPSQKILVARGAVRTSWPRKLLAP